MYFFVVENSMKFYILELRRKILIRLDAVKLQFCAIIILKIVHHNSSMANFK